MQLRMTLQFKRGRRVLTTAGLWLCVLMKLVHYALVSICTFWALSAKRNPEYTLIQISSRKYTSTHTSVPPFQRITPKTWLYTTVLTLKSCIKSCPINQCSFCKPHSVPQHTVTICFCVQSFGLFTCFSVTALPVESRRLPYPDRQSHEDNSCLGEATANCCVAAWGKLMLMQ